MNFLTYHRLHLSTIYNLPRSCLLHIPFPRSHHHSLLDCLRALLVPNVGYSEGHLQLLVASIHGFANTVMLLILWN